MAALVRDPECAVRRAAAGALGYAAGDEVLRALLCALDDPDWEVREEAAVTAAKLALEGAAPRLVEALGTDPRWEVRLKAAGALGRLAHRAAVPTLCEALRHPVSNLRKEAASALGLIAAPESEGALRAACDDPDLEVRKVAARARSRLGTAP